MYIRHWDCIELPTDAEAEYARVYDKQSVTLTEGTEHGGDASDH